MVGFALLLWPVPAVWTLLACLAGREARGEDAGRLSLGLKAMLGAVAAVSLLFGLSLDADPVSRLVLFAAVLVTATLPTLAFYALGYRVRGARTRAHCGSRPRCH
ncbi:hypothetical protein [Solirubrobacter soli]|uniref:hypothetical protein n=1 Tax=Solirubrobacter soli TaxID=363832 RepID=UPI00041D4521|nr:hypothetical protein [Solirubrobacter soli]